MFSMEKLPFSGHFLLSPPLKLDSSFPPFPFPTFHQVDVDVEGFNGIVFRETDPYSLQEPPASSIKKTSGRKRSLRKDRHSKIRTAQGLRDRRMRLSLDVAPEFFEIQDLLGFDKASKTLRWLITAAKPAIQELLVGPSALSAGCHPDNYDIVPKPKRALSRRPPSRRAAFPATIARESRIKARERARERTEKKKKKKSLLQCSSSDHHVLCNSSSSSSSSLGRHQLVAEVEEEQVTIFDYYNQSLMCPNDTGNYLFHEQWYMEDIQLQTPRLWEA